ncbi:MAG: phytanoyl-CoA dioxygenase family protein [Planctomycetes bacterium]|nr:phytanoyl-CoA dioxygenase family protein [Planctomycetota bacterium]
MTSEMVKKFFEEEGYFVIKDLMTAAEVAECQQEVRRLHELAAEMEARKDAALRNFQREPYAQDANQDGLPVLRKIEETRQYSEVFRRLAAHPRLMEVLHDLLGPDLLLFRSTLMLKPAFHGSAHGLHQDSSYWPMEPPALITVSIALTDSTPENGCFKVIPKSHRWGLLQWGRIARQKDESLVDRSDLDLSGQIEVPLRAGSALLFHSLVVHGSGPNTSPQPRNTALYAYFPPTVRYQPQGDAAREKSFPVVSGLGGRTEIVLVAAGR